MGKSRSSGSDPPMRSNEGSRTPQEKRGIRSTEKLINLSLIRRCEKRLKGIPLTCDVVAEQDVHDARLEEARETRTKI